MFPYYLGDMTPETNEQRIFTIFMLFVGMIAVFSTINDFATYIITTAERKALEKLDDGVYDPHAKKYKYRILLSLFSILFCLALGTVFFIYNEDWDFVQSLYFSVVTTVSGNVLCKVLYFCLNGNDLIHDTRFTV
mgnify:CR=1 FL=1